MTPDEELDLLIVSRTGDRAFRARTSMGGWEPERDGWQIVVHPDAHAAILRRSPSGVEATHVTLWGMLVVSDANLARDAVRLRYEVNA